MSRNPQSLCDYKRLELLAGGHTLPPESCKCVPDPDASSRACKVVDADPMSAECPPLYRHACNTLIGEWAMLHLTI